MAGTSVRSASSVRSTGATYTRTSATATRHQLGLRSRLPAERSTSSSSNTLSLPPRPPWPPQSQLSAALALALAFALALASVPARLLFRMSWCPGPTPSRPLSQLRNRPCRSGPATWTIRSHNSRNSSPDSINRIKSIFIAISVILFRLETRSHEQIYIYSIFNDIF